MELTFSDLKTKEVINTQDGKKLGKVCDVVFCYPENRWVGIVAPSGKGFGLKKSGGSDFHGVNKPDIRLGEGRGNLKIPSVWLDNLRNP